jgi:hypothetical protein
MVKLEEVKETQKIIKRRAPAPSLYDLTPKLMEKLEIKSPSELFFIIDRLRYLWVQDKLSTYEFPEE